MFSSFQGYVTYKPNSYCGGPTIQAGWLGTLQEAIDNCKHGPFNCGCVVDWEGDGRKYWRMEGTSTLPDPSSGSCAWVNTYEISDFRNINLLFKVI